MKRFVPLLTLALAVAGFGRSAQAVFLSLEDCETCNGATVSLDVVATGAGEFDVTYTIDFTGFDRVEAAATNHTYLTSIGFKAFEKGLTAADVLLMSAPNSSWADPILGNISNAGCVDGTSAELVCTNGLLAIPDEDAAPQVFSWDFEVSGALLKTDEWSIRGAFGRANGWVISESGTPIPEPTSALLFAVGFGVAGGAVRRRKN